MLFVSQGAKGKGNSKPDAGEIGSGCAEMDRADRMAQFGLNWPVTKPVEGEARPEFAHGARQGR